MDSASLAPLSDNQALNPPAPVPYRSTLPLSKRLSVKNLAAMHKFEKKTYLCTLCLTKLTFFENAKNEN